MTHKLLRGGWITNALKELDALFPFQIFKFSKFFQKLKFSGRHIFRLFHTIQFLVQGILLLGSFGFGFLKTGFWNLLELLRETSSWSSAFVREQGSSFTLDYVI